MKWNPVSETRLPKENTVQLATPVLVSDTPFYLNKLKNMP